MEAADRCQGITGEVSGLPAVQPFRAAVSMKPGLPTRRRMDGKTGMDNQVFADFRVLKQQKADIPPGPFHVNGAHMFINAD